MVGASWLGAGTFKKLLLGFEDRKLRFSSVAPGFVYDPTRHAPPEETGREPPEVAPRSVPTPLTDLSEPLADLVERLYEVVNLPRLGLAQYQTVFDALADQSGQQNTLGDITKNARDRAIVDGVPVGRQAFAYVARALHLVGCTLNEARMEPAEIARLFRASVEEQARGAQLELEAEDLRLLDELLGVSLPPG